MLKVIGAGFGRTGTLSLKAALEELGFGPCYHMLEVFDKPRHVELWQAAGEGKPIDWHELYAGYHAAVDWPTAAFYEQLMQVYPDAKVLLTVRDPEKWYASTMNTIYGRRPPDPAAEKPPTSGDAEIPPDRLVFGRMVDTVVWQGTFGGQFEDKQRAIAIFQQHIAQVKDRVPPDRLLVYDVKEGWAPLCRFLGVDVPANQPFPHLNDTAAFQQMIQERDEDSAKA